MTVPKRTSGSALLSVAARELLVVVMALSRKPTCPASPKSTSEVLSELKPRVDRGTSSSALSTASVSPPVGTQWLGVSISAVPATTGPIPLG